MPLISLLTGKIDFTNLFIALNGEHYNTLAEATAAGVATINYGIFFTNILNFLIVAFSIFLVIRQINKINKKIEVLRGKEESPTTKTCPYCKSEINITATRCPKCTSVLEDSLEG